MSKGPDTPWLRRIGIRFWLGFGIIAVSVIPGGMWTKLGEWKPTERRCELFYVEGGKVEVGLAIQRETIHSDSWIVTIVGQHDGPVEQRLDPGRRKRVKKFVFFRRCGEPRSNTPRSLQVSREYWKRWHSFSFVQVFRSSRQFLDFIVHQILGPEPKYKNEVYKENDGESTIKGATVNHQIISVSEAGSRQVVFSFNFVPGCTKHHRVTRSGAGDLTFPGVTNLPKDVVKYAGYKPTSSFGNGNSNSQQPSTSQAKMQFTKFFAFVAAAAIPLPADTQDRERTANAIELMAATANVGGIAEGEPANPPKTSLASEPAAEGPKADVAPQSNCWIIFPCINL
ncbi:hypothetical protein C8R43DRAFT_1193345 [Mycena crocata]|nr:hypothetical protein C8R43DRAFT_1193345 [Mycena crocata]